MGTQTSFRNLAKTIKLLLTGRSIAPLTSFYDPLYPPTKFLRANQSKINIKCIMCGFPRTGTHWIRNVIEKSSGLKTGDLYAGKPSPSDTNVIVIKVHARSKLFAYIKTLWLLPPFDFGGKYIYVYRDPRDAIISLFEMYKKVKTLCDLEGEDFLKIYDPIRQYRWEIRAWVLKNHKDLLLVKFEDLKQFPAESFQRIFSFLEISAPVVGKFIGEMVATSDSQNRPRGAAYGWKKAPKEYRCIIEAVSHQLSQEIRLLGYEDM